MVSENPDLRKLVVVTKAELDSLAVILKTITSGTNEPESVATLLEFLQPRVWLIAFSMCDLPFHDLVWLVLRKLTMR